MSNINLEDINKRICDRSECFYWQTDRKISAEETALIWKDRHSAITNEELFEKINSELTDNKLKYIKPFDETAQTSSGNVNSIRVGVLENGKEVIIRCHPKGVKNGYFYSESLAASLAFLLFTIFSSMLCAIDLFSSKKKVSFSDTILSTAVRAIGVPSFPFV